MKSTLEPMAVIVAYIIAWLFIAAFIWGMWYKFREWRMFKYDHNPYRRKCKRCGQWQSMYDNGGTIGANYRAWWEEIYPLGNNPQCKCKKYIIE